MEVDKDFIQYSPQELEIFLDTVAKLDTKPLMAKVRQTSDDNFKGRFKINKALSDDDYAELKGSLSKGKINFKTATKLFGKINVKDLDIKDGIVSIGLFSFDENKNGLNEYAIYFGSVDANWECELYFMKLNLIISKHYIKDGYQLGLNHYKDIDGKTVFYYNECYCSGTGLWWFNRYFYKYHNNSLIPILNEISRGNSQFPWTMRNFSLESSVESTNPLTIKMVYQQSFFNEGEKIEFINDSALVKYVWDEATMTLVGDFEKAKINAKQILSYYLEDNELLFIQAYNDILKSNLRDEKTREETLNYLNYIKNDKSLL